MFEYYIVSQTCKYAKSIFIKIEILIQNDRTIKNTSCRKKKYRYVVFPLRFAVVCKYAKSNTQNANMLSPHRIPKQIMFV